MSAARNWPLIVRRARPADEAPVMSFATETWNGWDYMPHAWPRWLEERDGVMLVGVVGSRSTGAGEAVLDAEGKSLEPGTVVAIVRVAMPATGEAWLEAIRVAPRVRGMDVATDLQVAELHWAAANGARVVRYATSARNEGSHRLGARGGFEQVVSLLGAWWKPPTTSGDGAHAESGFIPEIQAEGQRRRSLLLERLGAQGAVASEGDFDRLWQLVKDDATFNQLARLYEPRPWALEELTEVKFRDHVRLGEVLDQSARDGSGEAVAILVGEVPPAEEALPRLALLSGAPRAAFELIERARDLGGESIRFRYPEGAPLVEDVRELYEQAGYEFPDWALHIFARPLDDAHPVPSVNPAALILADEPASIIVPAH